MRPGNTLPGMDMGLMRWGALLIVGLCGGCVILPVPNAREEGAGVRSRVLDAEDGKPVRATIRDLVGGETATTDAAGAFLLKPHVQWHAGYLLGVISYPIWPFTGDLFMPGRSFRIEAPGYCARDVSLRVGDPGVGLTGTSGSVLEAPALVLHRSEGPRRF